MAAPIGHKKWGGRKKGKKNESTIQSEEIKAYLFAQIIAEKEPIIEALINRAKGGEVKAIMEILNRILGKPKEFVEHTAGDVLTNLLSEIANVKQPIIDDS